MAKKRKLSDHQFEIIIAMQAGYRFFKSPSHSYYLMHGRMTTNLATFYVLLNDGYIKRIGQYSRKYGQEFALTEKGKEVKRTAMADYVSK